MSPAMNETHLEREIAEFVREPGSGDFDDLARRVFTYQYERLPPFRELCLERGTTPESVGDWRQVPALPTQALETAELAAAPAVEDRSVHHPAFPGIYRAVIEATFPHALLPRLQQPPMLALAPALADAPDSSLSFMLDHVMGRFGDPTSATACGLRGVDFKKARSWLAARQRQGQPVVLLATDMALLRLLESLGRLDLRFRLAPGSRVLEAGGFKGGAKEMTRPELLALVDEHLAVPPSHVVRRYGPRELTSHFYTGALHGGDPDLFLPHPWTRVRILDPATREETAAGRPGLIAVFDLANLGSAVRVLTADLGVADSAGFRLTGRAAGTERRGGTLAVESLGGKAG